MGRRVVPHNGQVRVHGDGADEQAGRQISRTNQPSLHPTGRRPDVDAVLPDPDAIDQEGGRLVKIGQQEVVEQDQELVGVRLLPGGSRQAVFGILAHQVAFREAQGQINPRRGRSLGGLPLTTRLQMPADKLDGEI